MGKLIGNEWCNKIECGVFILLLFLCGCVSNSTPSPEPPPAGHVFDKTINLIITSEPEGADVYVAVGSSEAFKSGRFIGRTPLTVPVKYTEWKGVNWYEDCALNLKGAFWIPLGDGQGAAGFEFKKPFYVFFVLKKGTYGCLVKTAPFNDNNLKRITTNKGEEPIEDGGTYKLWPNPIVLLQHGREFSKVFANSINKDDYYGAEELRLRRIQQLENMIENKEEFYSVRANYAIILGDSVQEQMAQSELEQLRHTVGLLDPQLMGLRKNLQKKLQEGDAQAALVLAQAVVAMEERYFPKPQQPQVVVQQSPNNQAPQQGPQQIVVQQKPYYGATNIVTALAMIAGEKADPKVVQKALGKAQLADILGFGEQLNK